MQALITRYTHTGVSQLTSNDAEAVHTERMMARARAPSSPRGPFSTSGSAAPGGEEDLMTYSWTQLTMCRSASARYLQQEREGTGERYEDGCIFHGCMGRQKNASASPNAEGSTLSFNKLMGRTTHSNESFLASPSRQCLHIHYELSHPSNVPRSTLDRHVPQAPSR